jgi:hypothetical protein
MVVTSIFFCSLFAKVVNFLSISGFVCRTLCTERLAAVKQLATLLMIDKSFLDVDTLTQLTSFLNPVQTHHILTRYNGMIFIRSDFGRKVSSVQFKECEPGNSGAKREFLVEVQ